MKDVNELRNMSTIEICREFYEGFGADMIHNCFPEYEKRIAVGLVGEGSECFGFDDAISRDHDFGLGFCMWLNKEDYAAIGEQLQKAYHQLILREGIRLATRIWGPSASIYNPRIDQRRGVMEIASFYGGILKMRPDLELILDKHHWLYAEERWIATAVNGAVFRDDEGTFTRVRESILSYYPQKIFLFKLAEQLHLFSHGGQSNYPRMMARKDIVTSALCIQQTVNSAMTIAYMLNRAYTPYYKWMRKGLEQMPVLSEMIPLLEKLVSLPVQSEVWEGKTYSATQVNMEDQVIQTVEEIAGLIVRELNRQGIITGRERFLESYVPVIAQKAGSL